MNTSRKLKTALAAIAMASLTLTGAGADAASVTANLGVTATVISACVVSGGTINFGSAIDPTVASVPLDASTSLTVQCTSTTPYSIALNAGANAGGASAFSARKIKNGVQTLGYQLYTDAVHTIVWGDGTNVSAVSPGVGTGSNQSLTVYGRLPSLAGAVPGTYTDTVTVTVTY